MVGDGFMCAATTGTTKRQAQQELGRRVNNSALQLAEREQIPGLVKWPQARGHTRLECALQELADGAL